jgi:limonene 1,2-monooxygenase
LCGDPDRPLDRGPAWRDSWRVVVNMHVAETREQALADLEWGIMDVVDYVRTLRGTSAGDDTAVGKVGNAREAVALMTTDGIGTFGIAVAGTPDDAIAHIEKLQKQSGGFGSFLFLAHNCANSEATRKSYELFARYVVPHFQKTNVNRQASMEWAASRADKTYGGIVNAMKQAIDQYDKDKTKK